MRRFILGVTCVCVALTVTNAYARVGPADAYVIWSFNEGAGDTTKDLSDNKNDGTLTAGPKWVDGKFGKGVELAAKANVQAGTANGVSATFISECVWVKFKDFGTENQFGYINATGGASTRFFYFSTWCAAGPPHDCVHMGTLDLGGAWGRGLVTQTLFKKDVWYFVCGVIDNKTGAYKVYLDGKEVFAQNFGPGDSPGKPNAIWVGSSPENYQAINGVIDDAAFFKVALTADDVSALSKDSIAAGLAVEARGKLTTTWSRLKAE